MPTQSTVPDRDTIQRAVRSALSELVRKDSDLLEVHGHELSHVHRFGVYLEGVLGGHLTLYGLTIDMDYDRHGQLQKVLVMQPELGRMDRAEGSRFRPDLIVHHRGDDERNALVVEWKKNAGREDIELLRDRVLRVKQIYGYMLGMLVNSHDNFVEWCVVDSDNPDLEWHSIRPGV